MDRSWTDVKPPPAPATPPMGLPAVESVLATREAHTPSVLAALADTAHGLNWTRFFGPLSNVDARIDNPLGTYPAVVFCHGANIGPAPLARSFTGLDRRQIIWINQRHISAENRDRVISEVVAHCRRFALPTG